VEVKNPFKEFEYIRWYLLHDRAHLHSSQ